MIRVNDYRALVHPTDRIRTAAEMLGVYRILTPRLGRTHARSVAHDHRCGVAVRSTKPVGVDPSGRRGRAVALNPEGA